ASCKYFSGPLWSGERNWKQRCGRQLYFCRGAKRHLCLAGGRWRWQSTGAGGSYDHYRGRNGNSKPGARWLRHSERKGPVSAIQFLPATLFDANGLPYTVSSSGSLQDGIDLEFRSFFSPLPHGAVLLDVISGGTTVHFTGTFGGNTTATTVNGGRELDVEQ